MAATRSCLWFVALLLGFLSLPPVTYAQGGGGGGGPPSTSPHPSGSPPPGTSPPPGQSQSSPSYSSSLTPTPSPTATPLVGVMIASAMTDQQGNLLITFVGSPWPVATATPGPAAFAGSFDTSINCAFLTWPQPFSIMSQRGFPLGPTASCQCNGLEDWGGEGEVGGPVLQRDALVTGGQVTALWRLPSNLLQFPGMRKLTTCTDGNVSVNSVDVPGGSPQILETEPGTGATIDPCSNTSITLHGMNLGDGFGGVAANTTATLVNQVWMYNPPIPSAAAPWPAAVVLYYGSICITDARFPNGQEIPPFASCRNTITSHTATQVIFTPPTAVDKRTLNLKIVEHFGTLLAQSPPATFQYATPTILLLHSSLNLMDAGTDPISVQIVGSNYADPKYAIQDGWTPDEQAVSVTINGQQCSISSTSYCTPSVVTCSIARPPVGEYPILLNISGQSAVASPGEGTMTFACDAGFFGTAGTGCRQCPSDAATCIGYNASGTGLATFPLPAGNDGWFNLGIYGASGMAACPADAVSLGERVFSDVDICFVRCDPSEACLADSECASGYTSTSPEYRCATCAAGYYRQDGLCEECPSLSGTYFALVCIFVLFLAIGGFILLFLKVNFNIIKQGIDYFQIVSMLGAGRLQWPTAIKTTLAALSVTQINTNLAAPECIAQGYPFMAQFAATQLLPIALLLAVSIVYFVLRLAPTCCPALAKGRGAGADPESPLSADLTQNEHPHSSTVSHPPFLAHRAITAEMSAKAATPGQSPAETPTYADDKLVRRPMLVTEQSVNVTVTSPGFSTAHHGEAEAHIATPDSSPTPSTAPAVFKGVMLHGFRVSDKFLFCVSLFLAGMHVLYLILTKTAFEIYYCVPLDIDDGGTYLQVVFENCDRSDGVRATLLPYANASIVVYTVGYPVFLALILWKYRRIAVEDQILLAIGSGEGYKSHADTYWLRRSLGSTYEEFRPHVIQWTLFILFRKFALAVLTLLLNRSATMQMLFILAVLVGSYILQAAYEPFMPPIYAEHAHDAAVHPHHPHPEGKKHSRFGTIVHLQSTRKYMTDQYLLGIGLMPDTWEWRYAAEALKHKGTPLRHVRIDNAKAYAKRASVESPESLASPSPQPDPEPEHESWRVSCGRLCSFDGHKFTLWFSDTNTLESSMLICISFVCLLGLLHHSISLDAASYSSLDTPITVFVFLTLIFAVSHFVVVVSLDLAAQFVYGPAKARFRRLQRAFRCGRHKKVEPIVAHHETVGHFDTRVEN